MEISDITREMWEEEERRKKKEEEEEEMAGKREGNLKLELFIPIK